jgi:hypothetical protein
MFPEDSHVSPPRISNVSLPVSFRKYPEPTILERKYVYCFVVCTTMSIQKNYFGLTYCKCNVFVLIYAFKFQLGIDDILVALQEANILLHGLKMNANGIFVLDGLPQCY